MTVTAVSSQRFEAASAILRTHGVKHAIRTLDAIQLASAQALHARSRLAAIVAADKKLLQVAAAVGGFNVLDVG